MGNIQKYLPDKTYIIGKKWFYKHKNKKYSGEWNKKLGEVHYHNRDNIYNERLKTGLEWLRNVKQNGRKWKFDYFHTDEYKCLLPGKSELFPNMKNTDDSPYHELKKALANEIGEITQIAYCSIKHRENAHNSLIYSLYNQDCTAEIMGFKNKLKIMINTILKVNQPNGPTIIPTGKIKNNIHNFNNNTHNFNINNHNLPNKIIISYPVHLHLVYLI